MRSARCDDRGIVVAGLAPPLPRQRQRARVVAGGSCSARWRSVVRQLGSKRAAAPTACASASATPAACDAHRRVVERQSACRRARQRQVQRDQLPAIGGLELEFVIPARSRRGARGAAGRPRSQPRLRSRCGRRNSHQHRPAPVHLRRAAASRRRTARAAAGVSSISRSIHSPGVMLSDRPGRASARSGTPHSGEARRGNSQNAASASGKPIATSGQRRRQRRHGGVRDATVARFQVRQPLQRDQRAASPRPAPAPATAVPGRAGTSRTARTARSRPGCAHRAALNVSAGLIASIAASSAQPVSRPKLKPESPAPRRPAPARAAGAASPAAGRRQRQRAIDDRGDRDAERQRPRQLQQQRQQAGARGQQHPARGCADRASGVALARRSASTAGNSASARRQAWRCAGPCAGPSGGCPGSVRR